ncbi:uncharacterized protein UV8b_07704 [Ustilaginoidea virens]|uniref:DJ-1/PfpI domain-containing protein n=1 Tax=Ustilaginoidea virens TaxID=1159556 RepID=A0A063BX24_USTVR|nr:uncharacterized protein UV8b_07704 [Ustilaginoidea virens]QUC23463.1 hypothetical protein UV8b_07704 [Ustilaginoidea virens]GAO18001.1 hypothetical protein UVI_02060230 [Ustilaginoidea virens]
MSPVANSPPTKYGAILFPGFQALDIFGPLDILNLISRDAPVELSVISASLDPVSTKDPMLKTTIGQSVLPTHTFDDAPRDLEVLIVPGGRGSRDVESTARLVDYLRHTYPRLRYLLTVCTGSAFAARAGVLDGKRATTNKICFGWVTKFGDKTEWVPKARWIADGNVWTSSGISAGIDMMYAFVTETYGEGMARYIAAESEYIRNADPSDDPFAHLV